ncbi:hypothetical protein CQS04_07225 [Chryseomicrobium excrementi]|uniref:JAB domain-containing protein n=1 Tax=Chryseomicrobium excrementi TaxID=2041346 RepID=A0A2M9F0F1_9BACL|nr:hypothetical protein [Chryseomicrobium excrementi]PJK16938.1 hypothetical protein CQS04_07225 [Chryseomicrobium excrementi]
MQIEFINNTLSTMLLDCISHYPEQGKQKECFGLIFGEQSKEAIGEYTFPVANVLDKNDSSVLADEDINDIVKEARKLVVTSDFVACYHSHPYDEEFEDMANPSIGDLRVAKAINSTIEVIFALAKIKGGDSTSPLKLNYIQETQYRFLDKKGARFDSIPNDEYLNDDGNVIVGTYKDYVFRVHAYQWTGKALEDIKLYSSEVELNMVLSKAGLSVENLPKEAMYYVRKLEYSLRLANKEKYSEKIPYLLEKIKSTSSTQLL